MSARAAPNFPVLLYRQRARWGLLCCADGGLPPAGPQRTHDPALIQLGRTVRRIHALPLPADARMREPRDLIVRVWEGFLADFAVPDFARDAARRVLAEEPPTRERALVVGHNDLNPTNIV